MLTTLFALPEACLYADLVTHFEGRRQIKEKSGETLTASASALLQQDSLIHSYDMDLSYKNLFQDVREVIGNAASPVNVNSLALRPDYIHNVGELKKRVVADLPKYIQKDPRTGTLLARLRKSGAKTFLLTNSQYHYTNSLMYYALHIIVGLLTLIIGAIFLMTWIHLSRIGRCTSVNNAHWSRKFS